MKVRELKGHKSLRALNAFHALMLGLKMLPAYMHESYEDFFERIEAMPPEDQEKMIRAAVKFVAIEKDELEAILSFVEDKHGVAYSAVNMANLDPKTLSESVVAVCMKIAEIKIDLVSEDEKKNSLNSA